MFSIFKQTYKKMVFSNANFVITSLALLIVYFSAIQGGNNEIYFDSALVSNSITDVIKPYNSNILWLFLPIYTVLTSIKLIADEIEEGSFLTLLSKPISRNRIIIEKFLAQQTVNMTFAIGLFSLFWYGIFRASGSGEMWPIFMKTAPIIILVTFYIQFAISIFLVVLSLKFSATSLVVGVSFVTLFGNIATAFIPYYLIKNYTFQSGIGQKLEKTTYDIVNRGQGIYRKIYPLMFQEQINQIYYDSIAEVYGKEFSDESASILRSFYNKEVVFTSFKEETKDKIGKSVEITKYKVFKIKPWATTKYLKIKYSILTILFGIIAFLYFGRKDIV